METFQKISAALAAHGLILRGGFDFSPGEAAPPGPSGEPARAVLLVGNAGAAHWPHFSRWRETQRPDQSDPLDAWSRMVIGAVAERVGARLLMPNDRPYAPFQQWAIRAEGTRPSPLGILIHPEYGLWHAYRGALLFDVETLIQAPRASIHPCDACAGKPCLKPCPAGAFDGAGFGYRACLSHVRGAEGESCRSLGCLARNACPEGAAYRYPAAVQAFHQRAFAGL